MIAAVILSAATLVGGFFNPPSEAKPRTWWHWNHGFVTREGITADLESMKAVGLGGFTLFDVAYWPSIHGPVKTLTDEWYDLVLFAGQEAERLGLKMSVHNCPGWTSSGGPWITDETAMKGIAWEESRGRVPERTPQTVAILAVPDTPEGERIPDFRLKSFVQYKTFEKLDFMTNVRARVSSAAVIPVSRVLDLARQPLPEGDWTVLHFQWRNMKVTNHPATDEGRGWECDKMSKAGVDAALVMLERICADRRKAGLPPPDSTLVDSYERPAQTWTQAMPQEFEKRRGYSLLPYLPVLTGRYVEGNAESERFLRDFRRTIADLYAEYYGRYFAERVHALGLKLEIEPYPAHYDEPLQGSYADIPMGEFWYGGGNLLKTGWSEYVGALGRAWDRPVVQAESFTSGMRREDGWAVAPRLLKRQGDAVLAKGVNRFVFHTYAHQPWEGPIGSAGLAMGPWGMDFNRANPMFPYFKPWIEYLSRAQFLLQYGKSASDVLIVTSCDDAPVKYPGRVSVPYGYQVDLMDEQSLRRGTFRRYPIVIRTGGRFDARGVEPDVVVPLSLEKGLSWLHRTDGTNDVYYFANLCSSNLTADVSFRICGKSVSVWDAEARTIRPPASVVSEGCRTRVTVEMPVDGSRFVIFTPTALKPVGNTARCLPEDAPSIDLSSDWRVRFPSGSGAPTGIRLARLQSLSTHEECGVRYFSGEATYEKSFALDMKPAVAELDLGSVADACRIVLNGRDLGMLYRASWRIDVSAALVAGTNRLQVVCANRWINRMIGDEVVHSDWPGCWKPARDKLYLLDYPKSFADSGRSPEGFHAFASLRCRKPTDKLVPSGVLGPVKLRFERKR